ncbi:Ankyrin repeat protein [Aspergillus sclerotialis]|uniref:Ankyrin repeat protein n=1 Tax=Aspergillus sclerotialis TaxID=2070753 RepID=A0A3A2Z683_9EURO|nr:Ankyrin repeat protein [Aspergillus sclerotialis]
MEEPLDPTQFFHEMENSAQEGHLDLLKKQLARWEAGIAGDSITQPDYLGFKPTPQDFENVERALGHSVMFDDHVELIYFMLGRLMKKASRGNSVDVVKYLMDERKSPVTFPAVLISLIAQSFDVLEVFLAHGWDINEPLKYGPILRLLAKSGKEAPIRWCLEHGADPQGCDDKGHRDVLSEAGKYCTVEILRLLAGYGADFSRSNALLRAAERTDKDAVKILEWLLDEAKVPINHVEFEYDPEKSGMRTALHCAVEHGAAECVRYLLQRGIDVNLKNMCGRTARDIAQRMGRTEILETLDANMG